MKKLLLLLLSLGFVGSANADAVCNDGWISESTGSGTCSWHGGVRQWLPDGWCYSDCDCRAHKEASMMAGGAYEPGYGVFYAVSMDGCLYEQGLQGLANIIIEASKTSNSSKSYSSSKSTPPNAFRTSSGWVCKVGYSRHNNGCRKDSKGIPRNATKVVDGWVCNYGYKKIGGKCYKY